MAWKLAKGNRRWIIEGLGAQGPDLKLREKLMLFGQFVGDWDILEDRFMQPDGKWAMQRGELHWGWILDGKAVQDVWMYIDEKNQKLVPVGTTIRFYDPKIDAWHSIWISPNQGTVVAFVGRQVDDEILLEGITPEGNPVKWIFYEITRNSFKWRGEESSNGGKSWTLKEEMRIRRRSKRK